MLLTIIGNYVTKLITGDYVWNDVLHMRGFASNVLGEMIAMILFAMIGRIKNKQNNQCLKSKESI